MFFNSDIANVTFGMSWDPELWTSYTIAVSPSDFVPTMMKSTFFENNCGKCLHLRPQSSLLRENAWRSNITSISRVRSCPNQFGLFVTMRWDLPSNGPEMRKRIGGFWIYDRIVDTLPAVVMNVHSQSSGALVKPLLTTCECGYFCH